MPIIETSDGPVRFDSWSYRLQGAGGKPLEVAAIAGLDAGLVVTDHSRDGSGDALFTPAEVAAMQGGGADRKIVLSYISIGESEDFRSYWDEGWTKDGTAGGKLTAAAPDWLGPVNPEWPESRKIRYWDDDWQAIAIERIAAMAEQGFDGAYLDIVDAYYFWAHEVRRKPGDPKTGSDAAARMVDFIIELSAAARAINPDFIIVQQNAPFLLADLVHDTGGKPKPDDARIAAFHEAIAGIALEDLYLRGDKDENNRFKPDKAAIKEILASYAEAGEFVLSVDYVRKPGLIEKYLTRAEDDGFLPYASPDRGLGGVATVGSIEDDVLVGSAGRDRLYGRRGDDGLSGGAGKDVLMGNRGADVLNGGSGKDKLYGGKGADVFVFAPGDGRDVVADFGKRDRIDLTAFDAGRREVGLKAKGDATLVKVGDVRIVLKDVARSDIDKDGDFLL